MISVLTGISFLKNEFQLPVEHGVPEQTANFYKENMCEGTRMYETIDFPDNQISLSIADIAKQIYLQTKDLDNYNGIMVDGQGKNNFASVIAQANSTPGRKAFVFILHPDHAFYL